jgi:glycosyltransferase involved in cell wall biosynthesis
MEDKPDIIVFGNLDIKLYPFILFLLENKMPYTIIAHDSEIFVQQNKIKINDAVRRGLIIKNARCIAANSRHTRSLLEMWGLSKENIVIVHPPISEQEIKESATSYTKVKSEYYNLVTVCRLVYSKGIDIVLRALKIMDEQEIPYRYVIVGDGKDRKFLEELAGELGIKEKVHFMGNISEDTKWSLLRNADVFVMPSRVNPSVSHEVSAWLLLRQRPLDCRSWIHWRWDTRCRDPWRNRPSGPAGVAG